MILKKLKTSISVLSLLLLLTPIVVQAQQGPADSLEIVKPATNASVTGEYVLEWDMIDGDREEIPFQIDLFNSICNENGSYVGTIATSSSTEYEQVGVKYYHTWNASATQSDLGIEDGSYCLRFCGVFVKDSNNYYSLCERKSFKLESTANQPPKITSSPGNLQIAVGDEFTYQVEAVDPENDPISFEFAKAPDFLNINFESGRVTTVSEITDAGIYEVTIIVKDENGAEAEQSFQLIVGEGGEVASGLTFTRPKLNDVFIVSDSKITWEIADAENIEKQVLYYSQDLSDWSTIVALSDDVREYEWEISELRSGDYYIRIDVERESGEITRHISDEFVIDQEGTGDLLPRISERSPEAGAEIAGLRPEISIGYVASRGADIIAESVVVNVNGSSDNLECQADVSKVTCSLLADLNQGENTISISLRDSRDKQITDEWTFTANPESQGFLSGLNLNSDLLSTALLVLCVGGLLLLIPWLIYYFVIRRRKSAQSSQVVQTTTQDEFAAPEVMTNDNYDYSVGTQDYSQPEPETKPDLSPVYDVPAEYSQEFTPEPVDDGFIKPSFGAESEAGTVSTVEPVAAQAEPSTTASEQAQAEVETKTETKDDAELPEIEMPSSYGDEEIPDWLKDFEEDQPIKSASGEQVTGLNDDELNSAAKIHDDYGLALNNPEDNNDY